MTKRLRTGDRYARGPWRGAGGPLTINVAAGYIISARLLTKEARYLYRYVEGQGGEQIKLLKVSSS